MGKQRIVNDSFWTDPYVEDLDPSEKLLFLYLLTNPLCNIAGAYEIKIKRIAYETGFDKEMVDKMLCRFEADGKILREKDWIIMKNFAKNQSNNPNTLKGMQRIINSIPEPIIKALKGFESLPYFTLLNLTLPNSTLPHSDESEKSKSEIYKEIFNFWNKQEIIIHKGITSLIKNKIDTRLKDFSAEEIKDSISNYKKVLASPKTYFNHKWTLQEFLQRQNGMPVFLDKSEQDYLTTGVGNEEKKVKVGEERGEYSFTGE